MSSSSSPSSSPDVAITNKTAFPLNIAFSTIAPLQHMNALEPGDVWTTHAPPLLSIPQDLALSSSAAKAFAPALRLLTTGPLSPSLQSKWMTRLRLRPQVEIDVRFDHEHNRFGDAEGSHLWMAFVLRWLGLSTLIVAAFAFLGANSVRYLGLASLSRSSTCFTSLASVFGLISALFLGFSHREQRLASQNIDPTQTEGKIITASVPLHTLHPRPSASPALVASSLSPGAMTTAPASPLSPRAHRNLAVTWTRGRFALWDTDLDQEIPAQFIARR
ncbi:hypothetical protein HGRIS_002028 [Hohenbuehelia grisea]|uniref:Uncharacterized protein n=1 Tax=Hohenbuehelia grisea TaxID=104357 RepID=A0ABR3JL15_9AGAR